MKKSTNDAPTMFLARVADSRPPQVYAVNPFDAMIVDELHKTLRISLRTPKAWRTPPRKDAPPMGCALDWTREAAVRAAVRALRRRP